MNDIPPQQEASRLARVSISFIVIGFFIFLIGVYPDLVRLNANPQVFGILQILTFLFGIGLVTLGSYLFLYTTIHHAREHRLRHDVGLRLVGTGYVFCAASALADILGFGSHNITSSETPYLGPVQVTGVLIGVTIILVGLFLYSMKVE
ncbi:MAG: hypothetical protein HZB52_07180 [Chloroflexi bacterium]|nr:hypothetical protein [Chloroflexota bacterium]